VFTASNSLVSRTIRWFTKSPTSHVMFEFYCPILKASVTVDSDLRGVHLMPAFKTKTGVVAEFDCPEQARVSLSVVTRYLGERYDFGGLFLLAWPILLWRWLHLKVRHPVRRTHEVKCSELAALVLKEAQLPGTAEWDPEILTPADILRYCNGSDLFPASRPAIKEQ